MTQPLFVRAAGSGFQLEIGNLSTMTVPLHRSCPRLCGATTERTRWCGQDDLYHKCPNASAAVPAAQPAAVRGVETFPYPPPAVPLLPPDEYRRQPLSGTAFTTYSALPWASLVDAPTAIDGRPFWSPELDVFCTALVADVAAPMPPPVSAAMGHLAVHAQDPVAVLLDRPAGVDLPHLAAAAALLRAGSQNVRKCPIGSRYTLSSAVKGVKARIAGMVTEQLQGPAGPLGSSLPVLAALRGIGALGDSDPGYLNIVPVPHLDGKSWRNGSITHLSLSFVVRGSLVERQATSYQLPLFDFKRRDRDASDAADHKAATHRAALVLARILALLEDGFIIAGRQVRFGRLVFIGDRPVLAVITDVHGCTMCGLRDCGLMVLHGRGSETPLTAIDTPLGRFLDLLRVQVVPCIMHDSDGICRRVLAATWARLGKKGQAFLRQDARLLGSVAGIRMDTLFAPGFNARMADRAMQCVLLATLAAPKMEPAACSLLLTFAASMNMARDPGPCAAAARLVSQDLSAAV